jgi:A/G-specific adenine glycosylase
MKELNAWFQKNKRDFPWRERRTPYRVWVSEIMLQQTRASVVIPYFERWMALFPDLNSLAKAPLEQVIKAWEGLGYYSRARNLHAGAQEIVGRFGGEFPFIYEDLKTIKGLGPYTIGAILSFGFQRRSAAVDGNVTRVLARYFCLEENVCRQPVKRMIEQKAEALLDDAEPWVTAEALIELGATLCTPNRPRCSECPISQSCLGFQQNKMESLPIKNAEVETVELARVVAVIESEGRFLLKKGETGQVMADLYEFPYFEMDGGQWSGHKLTREIGKKWDLQVEEIRKLPEVKHTFTRYRARLFPVYFKAARGPDLPGYRWVSVEELAQLPFSSGHRKVLFSLPIVRKEPNR